LRRCAQASRLRSRCRRFPVSRRKADPTSKDSSRRSCGWAAGSPALRPTAISTRWCGRCSPDARIVCSATTEVAGNRALGDLKAPVELADVDVGVVRAAFGVAETGSVWLTEDELGVNALAFLSQHLVVLLDPDRIVGNMHDAYRDRDRFDAGYGVFMTGPSATADIEGVLIHGAQGIRSLTAVLVPPRRA
jgi:hypothetical protein